MAPLMILPQPTSNLGYPHARYHRSHHYRRTGRFLHLLGAALMSVLFPLFKVNPGHRRFYVPHPDNDDWPAGPTIEVGTWTPSNLAAQADWAAGPTIEVWTWTPSNRVRLRHRGLPRDDDRGVGRYRPVFEVSPFTWNEEHPDMISTVNVRTFKHALQMVEAFQPLLPIR